jgi:ribosomal protein S18 acetylase RimI-like enzyme
MRIRRLDCGRPEIVSAILQIQKAAYRVEAAIIGHQDLPPLRETAKDVRDSSEDFYGCYHGDDELSGIISLDCQPNEVFVCRLVVHPDSFRRGIGSALIRYAEAQARTTRAAFIKVNAAIRNQPALALYRKLGFQSTREHTTPDGVDMIELRKPIQ